MCTATTYKTPTAYPGSGCGRKVVLDDKAVTPRKIAVAYKLGAACKTSKGRPQAVDPDVVVSTDTVAAYKAMNKLEPN